MDISIIIPVYNVEEYLVECLESVKSNIEKLRCEVFLIDDSSTDGSTDIAEFYAESCEAFRYYRIEHGGPSKVRNFGVTLASGKYLYFMDADDILTEGALYKMFCMAEKNRTDLTMCMVGRIQGKKITVSGLQNRVFYNLKGNITHIRNHANLVYDTTVWNKLVLKSFYLKINSFFPEGYQYEDIPTVLHWHYCANGVTIVRTTGYLWRIRTGEEKQLTRILNRKALTDKIEMLTRSIDYIYKNGKESQILEAFQLKILDIDFEVYFDKLCLMESKDAKEIIHLLAVFIEKYVDKRLISKVPLKKQQLIQDVLHEDLDHLIQVVNYKNTNYSKAPVVETEAGPEMVLPGSIFTIDCRAASNEFLNTPPNCFIDSVKAEGTKLSIYGHLYFWRISVPTIQDQTIKACLLNEETGITVPVESLPFRCPYLTEERGALMNYDDYKFYNYDYNWTGFQINLDFNVLAQTEGLRGNNFLLLQFENRICKGEILTRGIKKAAKETCASFSYLGEFLEGRVVFDRIDTILINFAPIGECRKAGTGIITKTTQKETLVIKTIKETKKSLYDMTRKLEEEEKLRKILKAKLEEEEKCRKVLKTKLDEEIRANLTVARKLNLIEDENHRLQTNLKNSERDNNKLIKQKSQLQKEKEKLNKKIRLTEHRYEAIQKSLSYKLGRILTYIPRTIRDTFK